MGCLFPGAPDVGAYWRNIVAKVDAITDPPPEAWDPGVLRPGLERERSRVLQARRLPRAARLFRSARARRHAARRRRRRAGSVAGAARRPRGACSTPAARMPAPTASGRRSSWARAPTPIAARSASVQHALIVEHYTLGLLKSIHPELTDERPAGDRRISRRGLPRFDAETAPALIPNVTSGRIANRLDFMGPSYTVDAACASSLVAIDIAVREPRNAERYDLALVGGAPGGHAAAGAGPVLPAEGACRAAEQIRPFDKDADGTLLSEGVGMVVLKRRSRRRTRRRSDLRGRQGHGRRQRRPRGGRAGAARRRRGAGPAARATRWAGVSPSTIGLIEAHGTGTPVGDAIEVEALARVFGARVGDAPTARWAASSR